MALTATEEAQLRLLIAQQSAILSLAGNEATITSKLGGAKVTLTDLAAAASVAGTDLLLTRQGTADKSLTAQVLRDYIAASIVAGLPPPSSLLPTMRVATTANVAVLGGGAPSVVDGVTLATNDYVLVKDQTTAAQNGVYSVTTVGSGANGTWTRIAGANIVTGCLTVVSEGAANANSLWMLETDGAINVGTTALVFARQGSPALANVVRYTSAGSGTYTKPNGVKRIRIRAVGGGGGGAAGYGDFGAGGGGGAGGYCETFIASPASSYAYTVGAAGAAAAATSGGGNGGSTTIAGMTAGGGSGGQTGTGSGGVGGTATGGQLNVPGSGGGGGAPRSGSYADGGGGSGGSSPFGGGGAGGGRVNAYGTAGNAGAGGGGSGALGTSPTTNAGGAGYIEIEEYV